MRVLIADDNDSVRDGIAEMIEDNGWTVCGRVSDGAEALAQARDLQPDFILLDVSMPGINGLETAAAIKRDMPTVRVVIISQHDFDQVLTSAQWELADGFVDKARLGTELVPTIARILRKT